MNYSNGTESLFDESSLQSLQQEIDLLRDFIQRLRSTRDRREEAFKDSRSDVEEDLEFVEKMIEKEEERLEKAGSDCRFDREEVRGSLEMWYGRRLDLRRELRDRRRRTPMDRLRFITELYGLRLTLLELMEEKELLDDS